MTPITLADLERVVLRTVRAEYWRMQGPKVKSIARVVATIADVPFSRLMSTDRRRDVSWPRQVVYYVAREKTDLSLPQIARQMNRDHTTVMAGIAAVERRIADDHQPTRFLVLETINYIERTGMVVR